ncbi:restriction endonuclease subunit S [Psychroflexus sediminis]|uniref:Type I restriction enzyme, S subunit n=1 Tax=Psychroflexus sediminis TaxID=470826 RepID=A0A1G7XFN3_9FLAO|nr:restriction endonuclease subunit S [Psychroflexus sediminis]SDG82350.1 type I restriction enzyme, S subunit [Psychroflexus sediminis]
MSDERQLEPKLRFPEFDGEWEKTSLKNISKNISYGMNASAKKFDGKNKYLRITDIDEESREFKPNPLTSPSGKIDEKFVLKEGDILFTRTGASVGKSYLYNKDDGRLLFAGFLIRFNILKANPKFIFLQTLRRKYNQWVYVYSIRSGQPGLNAEEYKSFEVYSTAIQEQQKIADFLSSIDTHIQTLEKKKEALELYKKGVTQKIFKQEIRFKNDDDNGFPKWKKKKLGKVCSINKGEQLNKIELFESGKYPSISGGINPSGYTDKWNQDKNTIIISEGGNSCGYVNFITQKFWCGGHCYSLIINDNSIEKIFLYHLLKFYEPNIMRLRVGSGLPNIQKKDLSKFKLIIPSLAEQTKIADFLSAIDQQIQGINQQIEYTKTYKKGLLQLMFV